MKICVCILFVKFLEAQAFVSMAFKSEKFSIFPSVFRRMASILSSHVLLPIFFYSLALQNLPVGRIATKLCFVGLFVFKLSSFLTFLEALKN